MPCARSSRASVRAARPYVPRQRDGRVEHHERDLEPARVRVRVLVGRVVGAAHELERLVLLLGERRVGRDRVHELHHLRVLRREEAQQQQIERRGEGGRVQEGERHVHRVDVVRLVERRVPLEVGAVEHELGREGLGQDGGPVRLPHGHEHVDLAVRVREQQRVRQAGEQRDRLVALVGDEEVGVVDRVEAHRPLDLARLERELEQRQRDNAHVRLRDGGGVAHLGALVEACPREHVGERLDARHHLREGVQVRSLRRVQQVEQHELLLGELGLGERGRRRLGRLLGRLLGRRLSVRALGVQVGVHGLEDLGEHKLGHAPAPAQPPKGREVDVLEQPLELVEIAREARVHAVAEAVPVS